MAKEIKEKETNEPIKKFDTFELVEVVGLGISGLIEGEVYSVSGDLANILLAKDKVKLK